MGIDSTSGLLNAEINYFQFTDWDLGNYIEAIITANQLEILKTTGTWGATDRLNEVLGFLQTRQLTYNDLPYVWYQSANGNPIGNNQQGIVDAGQMLIALNELRNYRADLAGTINSIVYNQTNYTAFLPQVSSLSNTRNMYAYLALVGFASFWPTQFNSAETDAQNNIRAAPTVSAFGANLPAVEMTCDPLFLTLFNLPPNAPIQSLASSTYNAHLARYTATGKFTAFSEGNTGLNNPGYVYEFVVKNDQSTWVVDDSAYNQADISPIIFIRAAAGLLAINDSFFTESMMSYLTSQLSTPNYGYSEGVDENGRIIYSITGNTNSMIIQASQYALIASHRPTPTPTPTPPTTQKPSPTASQKSTPSPVPALPSASPKLIPSNSASQTPTPSSSSTQTQPSSSSQTLPSNPIATNNPEGNIAMTPNPNSNQQTTPLSSPTAPPKEKNTPQIIMIPTILLATAVAIIFALASIAYLKKRYQRPM